MFSGQPKTIHLENLFPGNGILFSLEPDPREHVVRTESAKSFPYEELEFGAQLVTSFFELIPLKRRREAKTP